MEGLFYNKERFIQEHPELKSFLQDLPDEGYFEYDEKTGVITYHLDMGLRATVHYDDCCHLPHTVKQMLQYLVSMLKKEIER